MRSLLILLASTICITCGDGHRRTNVGLENELTVEGEQIKLKKDILEELKSKLAKDGFDWAIDTVYHDSLTFILYSDDLVEIRSVQLHPIRIRTIKAKAVTALKGTDLYPRLVFQEAYFVDKIVTDSLVDSIDGIICNQDLINEKIYDMIIKVDNQHLIYISTDAKAFEKYVKRYGERLKILYKLQAATE